MSGVGQMGGGHTAGDARIRVRVAGDDSAYHCGSAAVFCALRLALEPRHRIVDEGDYEALYVNGEGSMHHGSGQFEAKMALLRAALDAGKRAYLVNSVWQENPATHDDVLARLSGITLREVMSQADLRDRHGILAGVGLDLSYYAPIDETAPAEDWAGQVVATDFYSRDLGFWYRVNSGPLGARRYADMRAMGWSGLVRSLRSCRAVITGRHHAVYAACVARRPFVAVAGNTHKVAGLIAGSGFPIPVLTTPRDTQTTLRWAIANRGLYREFFHWMDEQPRWTP